MNLNPKQQTTMRRVGAVLAGALLVPFLAFAATGGFHLLFAGAWGKALAFLVTSTGGIALQIFSHAVYNTWALARGRRPASIAEDAQALLKVDNARDFINKNFYVYMQPAHQYLAKLLYSLYQAAFPSVSMEVVDWLAMPREPKNELRMGLEPLMSYLEALSKDDEKALQNHREKLEKQVNDYLSYLFNQSNVRTSEGLTSSQASIQFDGTIKIICALVKRNVGVLQGEGELKTDIYAITPQGVRLKPEAMEKLLDWAQFIMPILNSLSPAVKSQYIWIAKQLYDVLMERNLGQHTSMAVLWDEVKRQAPRIIFDQMEETMAQIWHGKRTRQSVPQLSPLAQRLLHVLYAWRQQRQGYNVEQAVQTMMGVTALPEIRDEELYAATNNLDPQTLERLQAALYVAWSKNVSRNLDETKAALDKDLKKVARQAGLMLYNNDQGKRFRLVDNTIETVALSTQAPKEGFKPVTFYLGDPRDKDRRQKLRLYSRRAFNKAIADGELPQALKKAVRTGLLPLGTAEPFVLVNLDIAEIMQRGNYKRTFSGVMEFGNGKKSINLSNNNPDVTSAFGPWQDDQNSEVKVVWGEVQIGSLTNQTKLWIPEEVQLMKAGEREEVQLPATEFPPSQSVRIPEMKELLIRKLRQAPRYFDNMAELQKFLGLDRLNMMVAWPIYEEAKAKVDQLIETYYWPAEYQVHKDREEAMKDRNAMLVAYIEYHQEQAIHNILIERDWLLAPRLPEPEHGQAKATAIIPGDLISALHMLRLKPGYPFISDQTVQEFGKVRNSLRDDLGASLEKTNRHELATRFATSLGLVKRYIKYTEEVRSKIHNFYTKPASAFRASDVVPSTGGGNLIYLKPLLVAFFNWLLSPLKKMGMPGVDAEQLYSVFSGAEIYAIAGVAGVYAVFTGDSSVLTGNFLWSMFLGLHAVQSALNWYRTGDAMARYFWPAALISGLGLVFSVNPLTLGVGLHIAVNVVLGFPLVQAGINYLLARNLKTIRMSVKALPGIAEALETATAKPNQPLLEHNVIGQALKQALENKDYVRFFRDHNSIYDFQLITGPGQIFRFEPEAQADGRIVMTLHIPQAYRKFLEEQVPTAGHPYNTFLAMTLHWNIERAIKYHFRLVQQGFNQVERELLQHSADYGITNLHGLTERRLPEIEGQRPIDEIWQIVENKTVGFMASDMLDALANMAAITTRSTTLMDAEMAQELSYYMRTGQAPSYRTMLIALRRAAMRSEAGVRKQLLEALIAGLEATLSSGDLKLRQNESMRVLQVLAQKRDLAQLAAALDQQIQVSETEEQNARAAWVMNKTIRKQVLTLAEALGEQVSSGLLKQNLDVLINALKQPEMDAPTSARVIRLMAMMAPKTSKTVVMVIGQDYAQSSNLFTGLAFDPATAIEDKVDVAGRTVMVARPCVQHVFGMSAEALLALQGTPSNAKPEHLVWAAPIDARHLSLGVQATNAELARFESEVAAPLRNAGQPSMFNEATLDRAGGICESFVTMTRHRSDPQLQEAGWRAVVRAANYDLHHMSTGDQSAEAAYQQGLFNMNAVLAKGVYGKTEAMGAWHENNQETTILAPVALKTGSRYAQAYLWEHYSEHFSLSRVWERLFNTIQLRNYRTASAA